MSKAGWTVQPVSDPTGLRIGALWCGDSLVSYLYGNNAKELRRILRRGQAKPKTCVWEFDLVDCTVTTECDQVLEWACDPRGLEHGIKFCHACGGKVQWKEKVMEK